MECRGDVGYLLLFFNVTLHLENSLLYEEVALHRVAQMIAFCHMSSTIQTARIVAFL